MSAVENKPEIPANAALIAAWLSLASPVVMVFLAGLLPKDNPPLHPVNNSWYCQLTAFVCLFGILSAGWALKNRTAKSATIPAIAIMGIIICVIIGLVAMFLSSLQGMHT